jgi:hypothetical protein
MRADRIDNRIDYATTRIEWARCSKGAILAASWQGDRNRISLQVVTDQGRASETDGSLRYRNHYRPDFSNDC